jgi:hypothetical protein
MTPERIGDDVRRELGRFGPAGAIAEIVAAWPAAVGEAIARNAWPARVARDGTLHVATSSSAWAFELGLLEADIRNRLAGALAEDPPPRLRFAPGRLPEPSREELEAAPGGGVDVTPQHRQAGAEIAATVTDENLRELVARAAAASLAKASADRRF